MSYMYTNKGLKNNFTGLNQSNSIYEFNITKPNSISDIVYFSPYKTESERPFLMA